MIRRSVDQSSNGPASEALTGIAGEVAPQRQGTFEGLHGVLSGLIARADDKTAEQRDATRARQANELGASEKEPHLIRNTLLLGGVALVAAGIIYTQKDRILTAVRSKYDTLRENTGGIYARGQKLGNTVMAALSVTASFFQKSMEKAQAFHKGQTKSDKKEGSKQERIEHTLRIKSSVAERPLHGEDCYILDDKRGLYAVFDGAGGEADAKRASSAARDALSSFDGFNGIKTDKYWQHSMRSAMRAALIFARDFVNEHGGHGVTTAAVAKIVHNDEGAYLLIGSAGDSRLMLWREGQVFYETPEQCDTIERNAIWNYLGGRIDDRNDVDAATKLQRGDKILICSDGITGDWDDERLSGADFANGFTMKTPRQSAERFLVLSKKRDDKTAIVLFVD